MLSYSSKFLFVFLFASFFGSDSSKKADWNLVTEEDGITVFSRLQADSPIKEVRVETQVKTSFENLLELFEDVPGFTSWVYKCKSSERVKTFDAGNFVYHLETDMPFPVSNRDMVVQSTQHYDPVLKRVTSISTSVPKSVPEKKGVVRIQEFQSKWKIDRLDNETLNIVYEAKTDPAGYIPAWIVNLAIGTGPLNTMKAFREKLESKKDNYITAER